MGDSRKPAPIDPQALPTLDPQLAAWIRTRVKPTDPTRLLPARQQPMRRPSPELASLLATLHQAAQTTHGMAIDLAGLDLLSAIAARARRDRINQTILDEIDAAIDHILPLKVGR